jgi:S-phase kinase-associated protein 1
MVPRKAGSGNISELPCQSQDLQDDVEYPFDDTDLDDGLDPAMREEIDR